PADHAWGKQLVETEQEEGHREHNGRGEPCLRGLRAGLGLEPRLVLERGGDVPEERREISARPPLQSDRGNEQIDPPRSRAFTKRGKGRVNRRTQLQVGGDTGELAGDRPAKLA